jgi:hypothetical protein
VRRVLESWADVADENVRDAKQRVAKVHVWRRGSRAIEAAERIATGAQVAGLMMRVWGGLGGITSERWRLDNRLSVASLPAAV